jgi:chromosome segregation ATPase
MVEIPPPKPSDAKQAVTPEWVETKQYADLKKELAIAEAEVEKLRAELENERKWVENAAKTNRKLRAERDEWREKVTRNKAVTTTASGASVIALAESDRDKAVERAERAEAERDDLGRELMEYQEDRAKWEALARDAHKLLVEWVVDAVVDEAVQDWFRRYDEAQK